MDLTLRFLMIIGLVSLFEFFGFSQTSEVPPKILPSEVALSDCVRAAMLSSPLIKLADFNLATANAVLLQSKAKSGLLMGESIDYSHQGTFLDTNSVSTTNAAASAAGGDTVNGENLQGILSLTGPATSLNLTVQHSIGEGATFSQVSAINLSGSQTLFDGYPGGRANAAVQMAQFTFQSAQVSFIAARNSAVYSVKQAYYILLGDQDTVVLRQAIVGQAAENQALYNGLFTAQRATKLDVLQVQIELSQANLDLRTAQNLVLTDRKKLSLAVGWPLEKDYLVADSPNSNLSLTNDADALKAALQNRPEMLILEKSLAAAAIALSLQNSLGVPVLNLIASIGIGQDWLQAQTQGSFKAGLSLGLPPIYDAGLFRSQLNLATDLIATLKIQLDQQSQAIMVDVQNAVFLTTDTQDRQALAVLNLQQAQGQYTLERAKFQAGSGTTLDVLTAFSVLATARVGLVQAKSNFLLAVLNLDSVMGQ